MKKRKYKGQITILAAMIFGVVLSLIVTTVRSAAFSVGFLKADLVTQAGVLNEFSRFFRPLAEQFHVFFLEEIPAMEKEMEEDMYRSLKDDSHFVPVQLAGVFVHQAERATDNGGLGLKDNVVGYMQYGIISDVIKEWMGKEDYREKSEAVGALTGTLEKSTAALEEAEQEIFEMISWLDGIGINAGGFATEYDYPVFSGRDFLKRQHQA